MSKQQLQRLADDISANGLNLPIILWAERPGRSQQKYLLDGRNRLDAMELAGLRTVDSNGDLTTLQGLRWEEVYGIEPIVRLVVGGNSSASGEMKQSTDPWTYAMGANILRRHLSSEQKEKLIAALKKHKPDLTNRQLAETVGMSHQTVGRRVSNSGPLDQSRPPASSRGQLGDRLPKLRQMIANNPTMSNGAIAREIGVAKSTVAEWRKRENAPKQAGPSKPATPKLKSSSKPSSESKWLRAIKKLWSKLNAEDQKTFRKFIQGE
jgi:hypothetical protein